MLIFVLFLLYFASSPAVTSSEQNAVFKCRFSIQHSPIEEFRCQNGTGCIVIGRLCDGVTDCPDGSDELSCLPPIGRRKRHGTCTMPEHPVNGIFEVINVPSAAPGQVFENLVLNTRCRLGYGVVDASAQQVYCINGRWFQNLPRCVRFCKLEPDPSVHYLCRDASGSGPCGQFVAPGSSVQPTCNAPIYYSPEGLPYMRCVAGAWDYVAKCKAECGRITPEAWALVIDGRTAKRGELPWHVGIYRKTSGTYTLICGGTLVSNNVVISAAHCFWSDVKQKLPPSDFAVAIGKLYRPWNFDRDFDAQTSDVRDIKIPRLFQGGQANFQQDIAVLILTSPFTYKPHIRPVCLNFDRQFNKLQLQHGMLGKVAGWGISTAAGNPAEILQVVEMPYIKEDQCVETLPKSFREYITGDKFCAGYVNGTALCQGDSGGGLTFSSKELGIDRFYLRGIVSTAPTSDQKLCSDDTYTAFTKISEHEEFIRESIQESRKKRCPHYLFQCLDGTCADQGADCNGIKECEDGSDERDELCKLISNTTSTDKPREENIACILPPYPEHGTYVVANVPDAKPGQAANSWLLTVSCEEKYGLASAVSGILKNGPHVSCHNGSWDQLMPTCERPRKPGKFLVWFRNETILLVLWQPPYPAGSFTRYKVSIDPPDAIESEQFIEREGDPPVPAQATFRGLVPGRPYDISVQTLLGDVASEAHIQTHRTVPSRPQNVTVADVTDTSFIVRWLPPLGGEFDKYRVKLTESGGPTRKDYLTSRHDPLSAYFDELTPGAKYRVELHTMSGKVSSWPATVDVTLKPKAGNTTVMARRDTNFTLPTATEMNKKESIQ